RQLPGSVQVKDMLRANLLLADEGFQPLLRRGPLLPRPLSFSRQRDMVILPAIIVPAAVTWIEKRKFDARKFRVEMKNDPARAFAIEKGRLRRVGSRGFRSLGPK